MKVLHVTTNLTGGAGIAARRIHEALRQSHVDSRVLCQHLPLEAPAEIAVLPRAHRSLTFRAGHRLGLLRSPEERVEHRLAALAASASAPPSYELFSPPYSSLAPEEHAWAGEADIINLHWTAGALDWPRFFRRSDKPVVLTLHDQHHYLGGFHYEDDVITSPSLAALETEMRAVKRAALAGRRIALVANSAWNLSRARASDVLGAEVPGETILYPLDAAAYASDAAEARAGLELEPGRLTLGFASDNLANRRKGFADLLAAIASLPSTITDRLTLVSFGRAPTDDVRRTIAIPWRHLGVIEGDLAKARAYAAMDVFVVPSHAEAFGQTAIEAMASGVPVIASRVGGLTEALDEGRAGVLVSPAQPAELRSAIEALLMDPGRRRELATRGRMRVAASHSPRVCANAHLAVYRALVDQPGSNR